MKIEIIIKTHPKNTKKYFPNKFNNGNINQYMKLNTGDFKPDWPFISSGSPNTETIIKQPNKNDNFFIILSPKDFNTIFPIIFDIISI